MRELWAQRPILWSLCIYAALVAAVFCMGALGLRGLRASRAAAVPTPTFTTSPTATLTATATASATPMPTFTARATPTDTYTPSPTPSPTRTATPTPSPTATPTITPTPTATPIPTPDGVARVLRVPILMYHYLSVPPEGSDAVRYDLSVSPTQFEEQLRYLREAGYTGISLYDLALALQTGAPLPQKPIIITFDDGYRDTYTGAFPLLRKYGFRATVFLLTGLIDQGHPGYLTWEEVVEMDAAGMEIGAHGYSHIDLRDRSVDYLVWQILGAKEAIEAHTHKPVHFFCYPSGQYDGLVIKVLQSAQYWGAVSLIPGAEQCSGQMYELQRIRVRGSDAVQDLAQRIELTVNAPQESAPCITTP